MIVVLLTNSNVREFKNAVRAAGDRHGNLILYNGVRERVGEVAKGAWASWEKR